MSALTESTFHPGRQPNARFAELVAQMVGGLKRLLPALLTRRLKQVNLRRTRFEIRGLHSQQSNRCALFPVLQEEPAHRLVDFGIELRRLLERVGARERREIFVAQLQLDRTCEIASLAQPPAYHLTQPHQRGLQ